MMLKAPFDLDTVQPENAVTRTLASMYRIVPDLDELFTPGEITFRLHGLLVGTETPHTIQDEADERRGAA